MAENMPVLLYLSAELFHLFKHNLRLHLNQEQRDKKEKIIVNAYNFDHG